MNEITTTVAVVLISGCLQSIITVAAVKVDIRWLIKRTDSHEKQIEGLRKQVTS